MKTQTIRSVFENALKNERHDKNSETRFWCGQFKLLAKLAIEQLEQQEPVIGTKTWFENGKVVTEHLHPSDIYKDQQPKREPIACVIDGKLMAYKNGPLPDDCLLYDQAL